VHTREQTLFKHKSRDQMYIINKTINVNTIFYVTLDITVRLFSVRIFIIKYVTFALFLAEFHIYKKKKNKKTKYIYIFKMASAKNSKKKKKNK